MHTHTHGTQSKHSKGTNSAPNNLQMIHFEMTGPWVYLVPANSGHIKRRHSFCTVAPKTFKWNSFLRTIRFRQKEGALSNLQKHTWISASTVFTFFTCNLQAVNSVNQKHLFAFSSQRVSKQDTRRRYSSCTTSLKFVLIFYRNLGPPTCLLKTVQQKQSTFLIVGALLESI